MVQKLLNGLSPAESGEVMALGSRLTLPSGGSLFRLGDAAERLFLIERGRIRLSFPMLVRGQQEDVLFEEQGPGETVGWSAMVPPYRFTLSATAPLETELIALPREALNTFCERVPEIGRKIGLNLAVLVGQRLQLVQAMWMREIQRAVELRSHHAAAAR
ncbi:MAG TPA: cyclic nucleotide-binding domain-containing protein [Terracidiphilus sp.]|nr:cyclic nucleotide-binding domain-containing protein [Terracidiphilus sp.]